MEHIMGNSERFGFSAAKGMDTTFVLFFLALEYGRSVQIYSMDGLLMGITMMMVLVLPYFLPSPSEKPVFSNWLVGRGSIAVFGILLGLVFRFSLGVMLPESLSYLPFTMLIVASMVSCYIQFYGLMKLRLAK